jgi:hypothetical protein
VPKLKILSVIVLSLALSGAVYAAGRGGGGGGHGGGGGRGGGGGHFGGGGHVGGGGHFGGMRGGGAHFGGMRGGGARFSGGGGRHFSAGSAISRSAGRSGFSGNRSFAVRNSGSNLAGRNAAVRSRAVHNALSSHTVARAMHNRGGLHNPGNRALIAASAATAGWHHLHGGWWRHGNGGYGWVGPLFWPFAYYDIYDYSLWGYDPSFWGYGYGDIYAGMFAPYGYDDLTGYLPSGGGSSGGAAPAPSASVAANSPPDELSQMCGDDSRDIAGLPIDRIQQAIQPNDAQRTALDDLANASVKAAQGIKAACPTQIAATAPGRLAAMQTRLEAMIAAVGIVQPPLDHFYGLLNDEQKARLTALGQNQRDDQRSSRRRGRVAPDTEGPLAQGCGAQPDATDWPAAEIEARLHPTEAQRASFTALKDASARARDMLKASCKPDAALTPPARLAAVGERLDTMLESVEIVRAALDDLYGDLTDEQKAQFEAIGPGRSVSSSSDESAPTSSSRHYRRRHHASIGGIVRRLIGF